MDGSCTRTYDCNEDERFLGIIDREGTVFVAEHSNDNVRLVDTSGDLSPSWLSQDNDILHPSYIYLHQATSRLYLTHGLAGSQEVRVFSWHDKPRDTNLQLEVNVPDFSP